MFSLRSLFAAVALTISVGAMAQDPPPPAAETDYAKPASAEEAIKSTAVLLGGLPVDNEVPPPAPETTYNPQGTVSDSPYALISSRRDDPEFPGFLEGMQQAAIAATGKPLAVAPASAKELLSQHQALIGNGAKVFLVDSPDPQKAAGFFQTGRFLEINAVLLTARQPEGFSPTMILVAPHYTAERVGEEAIRAVGNTTVRVGYVSPQGTYDGVDAGALKEKFLKPFSLSAGKIELVELAAGPYKAGEQELAVVCALTPADARKELANFKAGFPDAKVVVPGESDEIRKAMESGTISVRVRPDYAQLLRYAVQEATKRSDIPPVVVPTADVRK